MDVSTAVFETMTHKTRKWLVFPTPPSFDAPLRGTVRISWWNLPRKN